MSWFQISDKSNSVLFFLSFFSENVEYILNIATRLMQFEETDFSKWIAFLQHFCLNSSFSLLHKKLVAFSERQAGNRWKDFFLFCFHYEINFSLNAWVNQKQKSVSIQHLYLKKWLYFLIHSRIMYIKSLIIFYTIKRQNSIFVTFCRNIFLRGPG